MRGRTYPSHPMVGVGVVVFNEQQQVLLIQRGQEPNIGLWAIPGGLVEVGEELKHAAKREVLEECNLAIDVGEVVSVLDLILKDQEQRVRYHYVLIDYMGEYISGEVQPQTDVLNADWFSVDEIANMNVPEATVQVIKKAVERRFGNVVKYLK